MSIAASRSRSKLKQKEEGEEEEGISRWIRLPVEIIHDEIFLKLPGNSILSSRCVCKLFNNILSRPNFIKKHVNLSIHSKSNSPRLLFSHFNYLKPPMIYSVPINYASISSPQGCEGAVLLNYPFQSNRQYHHRYMGSCNGLICIKILRIDSGRGNVEDNYFTVLNPFTGEFKEFRMQTVSKTGYGIAYGFGYDSIVDDYKLVAISENETTTGCSNFEVYSVGSGSLSSTTQTTLKYSIRGGIKHGSPGLFLNGNLHWFGYITTHETRSAAILCYNISNGIMVDMPLPEYMINYSAKSGCIGVGVWGDYICIALIWDCVKVEVWMMQEYGVKESWVKKYTSAQLQPLRISRCWKPLWCFDNGEVLVDSGCPHLVSVDPTTRVVRSVVVRDIIMDGRRESYVESIASVNSGTYLERRSTDGAMKKNPERQRD